MHLSRDATWTRVRGKLAEIDRRKVAEVVRVSRDKKQRICDPFFRALSETHSEISLETFKA